MIALIFAPLAAIAVLWLSARVARSLAPQRVLASRAVSSAAIGGAAEVTAAAPAAFEAKLAESVIAAGGPVRSHVAASASRADTPRPQPRADAAHARRRAAGPASEPWPAPA